MYVVMRSMTCALQQVCKGVPKIERRKRVVHQYKNNGYNIVLDVNSGMIHLVDELAYDMIHMFEQHTEEEILNILTKRFFNEESKAFFVLEGKIWSKDFVEEELKLIYEEIKKLKVNGCLFTQDVYEAYAKAQKPHETVVKALCLHIAHDCNLACQYCFAEEGEYHGRRELMSFETGKLALDFLIRSSGNRKNLEVDFFGGEPLLNFQVVKNLVEYGRSLETAHNKKFRFTLTTNGVLLNDDVMEFANREMSNVVLSIDGRKEVNDKMRPFRNGSGSYDHIINKFRKFAEMRNQEKYFVRGTFTRHNLDFSEDVKHLADLGFEQISVEPVVAMDSESYSIRVEDLPFLKAEYDKLAVYMLERKKTGKPFHFFHFMIDLSGGPCVAKRMSGCGSGTEYLAVTPWGDLYPCHQFVGEEQYLMGNVNEGVINSKLLEVFRGCNVYSKEKCKSCFAKYYCSGGCAANAHKFHGRLTDVYEIGCELERKRVECAIMLKAAESAVEKA